MKKLIILAVLLSALLSGCSAYLEVWDNAFEAVSRNNADTIEGNPFTGATSILIHTEMDADANYKAILKHLSDHWYTVFSETGIIRTDMKPSKNNKGSVSALSHALLIQYSDSLIVVKALVGYPFSPGMSYAAIANMQEKAGDWEFSFQKGGFPWMHWNNNFRIWCESFP
jgi:hypothetical protein